MNRTGTVFWVHLAGAGSLAGWVTLAMASHRMERPLPLFLGVMAWEWLILLAVLRVLARGDGVRAFRPVLAWALAFLLCGVVATPVMEDDHFRFLWDGWQFATTGNPYAQAPSKFFGNSEVPDRFLPILDQINYPHVPTIYGPVCQAGFLMSYWIAPGRLWPWKLLLCAVALALVWIAVRIQAWREANASEPEKPAQVALLIGWCPLLIFETGFNAHPDALGVLCLCAALLARLRGGEAVCGILCGVAVAAKAFALPFLPFLLGRSRAAWLGCAAALVAAYGPFLLQGSGAEFAGLMTFARDWEFNSSLYGLARWGLGVSAAKALCGAIFVAVWGWLYLRWWANKSAACGGIPPGAAMFGTLLLCSATVNPWYLLWLAPFVAWRPTAAGLAALALVSLSYLTGLNLGWPAMDNFAHPWWVRPLEYGGIAVAAVVDWWRARAVAVEANFASKPL